MTGEVIAGIGSSASILYYNDVITYPDNTTEPMNLQVVPLPKTKDADLLVTLAGVGLCSYKTTEQKAEAAAEFARYITEEARNFEFVASTGYMPVNKGSFEKIKDYAFESKAYETKRQPQSESRPLPDITKKFTLCMTGCARCSPGLRKDLQTVKTPPSWLRKHGNCFAR